MAPAKKKTSSERQTIAVAYRIIPYFAVEVDHPRLAGIRGVGESPYRALVNMRGAVRSRFPASAFDLEESIANPEFIEGWSMPEPF